MRPSGEGRASKVPTGLSGNSRAEGKVPGPATSQDSSCPSADTESRTRPPEANTTSSTGWLWPRKVRSGRWCATSHTMLVPLVKPAASRDPFGENASAVTPSSCPGSTKRGRRVLALKTATPSRLEVASSEPSRLTTSGGLRSDRYATG